MSEIIKECGVFRFINRTRYNSDDICYILNCYRDAVRRITENEEKELIYDNYRMDGVPLYDITDYNATAVFVSQHVWENGQHHKRIGPVYTNPPGYSPSTQWKMGLVVPTRLYLTEMEAITQGLEVAPFAFTSQVADMLFRLFRSGEGNGVDPDAQFEAKARLRREDFRIRINAKRESSATSDNRKSRVLRGRCANLAGNDISRLYDVRNHMTTFSNAFKANLNEYERADVPLEFSAEEAASIHTAVEILLDKLHRFKSGLLQ